MGDTTMADRRALAKALLEGEVPDYGYGPMTSATRAGARNPEMRATQDVGEDAAYRVRKEYGTPGDRIAPVVKALAGHGGLPGQLAAGIFEQPLAAGKAVGEAIDDPSLPNIVNAGGNVALAAGAPLTSAGIVGAGYGTAMLGDAARSMVSPAQAGGLTRRELDLEKFKAEQEANARTSAARIAAEADAKKQAEMIADAERQRRRETIENAKSQLMGDLLEVRKPPKDETLTGQLYDKVGGLTPLVAGVAGGALARAAKPAIGWSSTLGPEAGTKAKIAAKIADDYVNPALVGAEVGGSFALAPKYAEAYRADPSNPEYRAWQNYVLRLPSDAEAEIGLANERLQGIEPIDPSVTDARRVIADPTERGKVMIAGGLAGLGGSVGAAALPQVAKGAGRMVGDAVEGLGTLPGRAVAGYRKGMGAAAEAEGRAATERTARDIALENERANQAVIAEAQRRRGAGTGASGPAPAASGDQPLQIGSSGSPSPAPVATGNSPQITSPASGPQVWEMGPQTISAIDNVKAKLAEILTQQATGGGSRKALPPAGGKPGRVGWQNTWSDPAREAALERAAAGGTLEGGSGGWSAQEIQRAISSRLPAGTKPPSTSRINEQRNLLISKAGTKPTEDELSRVLAGDKDRLIWSMAAPAALGASGEDPREVARRLVMGR